MRPIDADALFEHKVSGVIGNLSGDFVAGFVIDRTPTLDFAPRQPWISVNDRLPELEQEVLVYAVGKEDGFADSAHVAISQRYVFHILPWDKGVEEWQAPWAYFNKNYEVTHWMPLPKPPKEE